MRRTRKACAGFAGAALVALALAGGAAPSSGVLSRVWISAGVLHATYRLPPGMQPYGLSFANAQAPGVPMMLLPGAADGRVAPSHFEASRLSTFLLTSTGPQPVTYLVRLLYGREHACGRTPGWNAQNLSWNAMLRCAHHLSNPVRLVVGDLIGPGTLVAAATGHGDFADATVDGSVKTPNSFRVAVSSTPSGQLAHVDWDVTCTKGGLVKEAGGSWDETTPVDDMSSVRVPFATLTSSPAGCTFSVTAGLEAPSTAAQTPTGTITLRLYAYKTHL